MAFMETTKETKARILEAAGERFDHYGFHKTTMAEIAKDCSMSAANLYRFFKNKTDIGAGIAERYFHKAEALVCQVVTKEDLSAAKKLESFVLELLHFNFSNFEETCHCFELVDYIVHERHDIIEDHIKKITSFLTDILTEGNKSGELNVEDVITTAEAIKFATMPFHAAPVFLLCRKRKECTLEELEGMAKMVVTLLVKGVEKR